MSVNTGLVICPPTDALAVA